METVTPFEWKRIFLGTENEALFLLEIGFRVTFIYLFAVLVMRLLGKRGNRSLSMFENVLIIALGSAIGDTMFYPKVPLIFACIVIVLIVAMSRYLQYLQINYRNVNTFLDGKPTTLIKKGEILEQGLKDSRIRKEELYGMLREHAIRDLGDVEYAILERTGKLSIFTYKVENPTTKFNLIDEVIKDEE
ncbi:DUF421 domain-containing protein [Dokdonia sp. Hel_I_53]|uniref:DUF421 domain-containing protein n=1 Tax=Dokdonia sp. Hel_I_53 TaxID=1566287 RepID=UPI001199D5F6|nr:YetF domain-containing protein [Dokdonia sp. Hel_I_53]TVZ53252.1 uncharacterized membrane protein YcaP (DUF421 family) [Dokdonia sp. Hel_I_53]